MSFFSIDAAQGPVWMDGRLVPWDEATLHALSHGLNNASCVFEGARIYAGKVFRLEKHARRLLKSAEIMGITMHYTLARLCEATEELVRARGLESGYVRPVVWKGHEDLGIAAPHAKTHVAIAALSLGDVVPAEVRAAGVRLKTSSWARPAPNTAPLGAKASCHYALGSLAMREAQAAGFDDALLLDYRGFVAEATGTNIFIVKNGALLTPIADCALDGITRQAVLELARRRNIDAAETRLYPKDVCEADEAFLTGTASEILPIRAIDGVNFPAARPITDALTDDYFSLVGKA